MNLAAITIVMNFLRCQQIPTALSNLQNTGLDELIKDTGCGPDFVQSRVLGKQVGRGT